ncbi:MAG: DJ-1/PfpI/YhbO family deglycase/protease, partial [Planctomycetes bacterium]|nr:DJ-1/PfpI/YhbO family deglycase/protease [Planctomycetota bacterium]
PGHNYTLNANFSDVVPDAYDALILPGGRAPEYLRLNPRVIEIVKQFKAKNKPIAAICHGMQLLTAANIVKGKTCTSYCAVGPEITLAGGKYVEVPVDQAVVDGNLITSPAWPSHPALLAKLLQAMG